MLANAQGLDPEKFYVVTPDPLTPIHEYRTNDYAAYLRDPFSAVGRAYIDSVEKSDCKFQTGKSEGNVFHMSRPVLCLLVSLSAPALLGCPDTKTTSPTALTAYDAVWIYAVWSGGKTGSPLNYVAKSPASNQYVGGLCPASSIVVDNWAQNKYAGDPYLGLQIYNNCAAPVTLYACVTKGAEGNTEPANGLGSCALDPITTSIFQLRQIGLPTGQYIDIPSNRNGLNLNIFYCSDQEQMALVLLPATPLKCVVLQ